MPPACKVLRPYQVRLGTDVCRASGDVLVEQPTGSGKTMQIVTLVAMRLGRRFTHAVISAPQEQIEHGFVQRDYARVPAHHKDPFDRLLVAQARLEGIPLVSAAVAFDAYAVTRLW